MAGHQGEGLPRVSRDPPGPPRRGTYRLSLSGISLIAMRTWLLRQRPA